MWNTVYFGYSIDALKEIMATSFLKLVGVVGVKGRVSKEYFEVIEKNKIIYLELDSKPELSHLDVFCVNADIILMYKFEYILPKIFVEKYNVFNFHGGDLRTNRGAHAVVWSIINNEQETCLSLYKLTGGIDEGEVIGQYWVRLDEEETVSSLNKKLASGIPILLIELKYYLTGNKKSTLILGGKYRRKINEADYTIDLVNDNIGIIKAKIRSQYTYNGAICYWNGEKKRVKKYIFNLQDIFSDRLIKSTDYGVEIFEGKEYLKIYFLDE